MTAETKIRIAYLMHGMRNIGGGEGVLYNLVSGINRDKFIPIVCYSHQNKIVEKLKDNGVEVISINFHNDITSVYRDDINITPYSLFHYARHIIHAIYITRKALKKYEVDVLHPHDNLSKIIGGVAAKLSKVKTVSHCHDLLTTTIIERILAFYQLLFMDKIIAVSEGSREAFKFIGYEPNKVKIIYNGVDLKRFILNKKTPIKPSLNIRDGVVVIGIIGVFDSCKGHIYLFRAIQKLLSESVDNFICIVVGDGREEVFLRSFVEDNDLSSNIIFLGYRDDIPDLLQLIDILVVPSTQESFGMVIIEAMAMQTPVIGTNIGGIPELVHDGETGIIVPPKDINSLSVAISCLISDFDLRCRMGVNGRKKVEKMFDLDLNIKKTEDIYLDLID